MGVPGHSRIKVEAKDAHAIGRPTLDMSQLDAAVQVDLSTASEMN